MCIKKKKRAPQYEIISSTSVINHICQNEDMSKTNTATAISQQHVVDRAMTGEWTVCSNEIFIRKSGTLLSWLIRAARWAWPLGWGMDLCESEPVWGETLTRQAHTFTPFSQLAQTYLPTVMWKFPATLLTNRYPCILQAVSEAEPSSLRPEGAGEQSHTMQES